MCIIIAIKTTHTLHTQFPYSH